MRRDERQRFTNSIAFPVDVLASAARQASFETLDLRAKERNAARQLARHVPEAPKPEQVAALHDRAETTARVARSLTQAALRRVQ